MRRNVVQMEKVAFSTLARYVSRAMKYLSLYLPPAGASRLVSQHPSNPLFEVFLAHVDVDVIIPAVNHLLTKLPSFILELRPC